MEHKSYENVLDGLDYTIVDNNSQFLGIQNLEMIRIYLLDKRDEEYNHVDRFQLPYILEKMNCIIENNFKFNNGEIKAEYIKLRKQLINWFVQGNTQDENGNDDVDIIEYLIFVSLWRCRFVLYRKFIIYKCRL